MYYVIYNVFKKINNIYIYIYYFLKKYFYTINHKKIALNYLYFSFLSGLTGTFLATLIKFELSTPGSQLFKGDSIRYLQIITLHALIMIFFVVVPLVFGFFSNFFIPYHLGTKDVAFPRLNSFSFWVLPLGYILLFKLILIRPQLYKKYDSKLIYKNLFFYNKNNIFNINNILNFNTSFTTKEVLKKILISDNINLKYYNKFIVYNKNTFLEKKSIFFVKCTNSNNTMAGWTYITPFSSKINYTALGALDISIIAILVTGISSTLSLTNLLITRRILSIPGLKYRKSSLPFFTISLFLVMRMLSLITPVLAAAMIMLISDRHFNTSFFDYAYGGDVILFNHLFWFFGHPEVYVVIIPAFGIINTLLPYYNKKLLISKNHLIWATYIMGYMGFLVWGHHMYLVGLDHRARSVFSTITIMISLPAIIKIVNWTLTWVNSFSKLTIPILCILSFFFFFLSGGLTGLWLSHVSLNLYIHDTFYVVAHFHFMFSCSVFSAMFAAIFHYYNQIFLYKYNKKYCFLFIIFWNIGQWLTFVPLYWVGYNGLPRRYHDYNEMFFSWHSLSSYGHNYNILSIFIFFIIILESNLLKILFKKNKKINTLKISKRIIYYLIKI